jgi:hypothetical protein
MSGHDRLLCTIKDGGTDHHYASVSPYYVPLINFIPSNFECGLLALCLIFSTFRSYPRMNFHIVFRKVKKDDNSFIYPVL